jgi:hypothetical protein
MNMHFFYSGSLRLSIDGEILFDRSIDSYQQAFDRIETLYSYGLISFTQMKEAVKLINGGGK